MAEIRTIGITTLKVGDILPDGGMATTLAALGVTLEGTATLETAESSVTDFFSEESDVAIETIETPGKTVLKWNIVDFTPATLDAVLGGSVTGSTWSAPDASETIEKSIEIVTRKNLHIEISRAKIAARLVMNLSKSALGQVEISATVLDPSKTGEAAMRIFYQAPA